MSRASTHDFAVGTIISHVADIVKPGPNSGHISGGFRTRHFDRWTEVEKNQAFTSTFNYSSLICFWRLREKRWATYAHTMAL